MADKFFLDLISVVNNAMRDVDNKAFNYLRFFLQCYLTVLIMLKVIVPLFNLNEGLTLGSLFMVPVLFVGIGYLLNKGYSFIHPN